MLVIFTNGDHNSRISGLGTKEDIKDRKEDSSIIRVEGKKEAGEKG